MQNPLLEQLHPDPADRRFLTMLASCWLGLTLLAAGSALLLDPLGDLGTGLVPPVLLRDRNEKCEHYLRLQPRPEVLVLGSSHVMGLRPSCLAELAGQRAFNFAVTSAGVDDYVAILRFVQDHGTLPRRLVIGVDPEAFLPNRSTDRVRASYYLARYVERGRAPSRWSRLGPDLLASQVTLASLRSLQHQLVGRAADDEQHFDPDGRFRFTGWARRDKDYDQAKKIQETVQAYRGWYLNYHGPGRGSEKKFRKLLQLCKQRGIAVDAFIPALHPRLPPALERTAFAALHARVDTLLRALHSEGLLVYHDLPLAAFGGVPGEFFDGEHMGESNGMRLLRTLFDRPAGCAVAVQ